MGLGEVLLFGWPAVSASPEGGGVGEEAVVFAWLVICCSVVDGVVGLGGLLAVVVDWLPGVMVSSDGGVVVVGLVVLAVDWFTFWDSAAGVLVVVGAAVVVVCGGAVVWVAGELREVGVAVDWLPGV